MLHDERGDRAGPMPAAGDGDAEPAEVRLINRVAAGDLDAFERLYRLYHGRLTRFLDRMTRRRSLVEEVLNDTMLTVWKRSDRYNGTSKVSTWIFAIAYRKALKALQRSDEAVEDADAEQESDSRPDDRLERHEASEQLARAIAALSHDHRAVVVFTYFHDMGYREIAQIVDCPVDTVKTRMFHARRRLRAMLAGDAEDWL